MNLLAQWHLEQDRLERRRWWQSSLTVALIIAAALAVVHWRPRSTPVLPTPALPLVVELAPSLQSPADSSGLQRPASRSASAGGTAAATDTACAGGVRTA